MLIANMCIGIYYTFRIEESAMEKQLKTVSVSFRVSPRFKMLLEAAAKEANRSQTNLLEQLLFEHCEQTNIKIDGARGNAK